MPVFQQEKPPTLNLPPQNIATQSARPQNTARNNDAERLHSQGYAARKRGNF